MQAIRRRPLRVGLRTPGAPQSPRSSQLRQPTHASRVTAGVVCLWMLCGVLVSAAEEVPPAKNSPAADTAALLPFAEMLKGRGPADGVVLAQVTELNNTRHGTWGTCGIFAVTGLAVFETLATVAGTSPGPRFVLGQQCPSHDLIRPGKHLVAWRKKPTPDRFDVSNALKKAIDGLPLVSGQYYAFDGAVIAAPPAQAQRLCPQPLPEGTAWVDYSIRAVAVGDPATTPGTLALPCPVGGEPLLVLWRRDSSRGVGILSVPAHWNQDAPGTPFLFPKK